MSLSRGYSSPLWVPGLPSHRSCEIRSVHAFQSAKLVTFNFQLLLGVFSCTLCTHGFCMAQLALIWQLHHPWAHTCSTAFSASGYLYKMQRDNYWIFQLPYIYLITLASDISSIGEKDDLMPFAAMSWLTFPAHTWKLLAVSSGSMSWLLDAVVQLTLTYFTSRVLLFITAHGAAASLCF